MKIPAETKPAIWGAVGGAVLLATVGFAWGGWVTGGTAHQMAMKEADTAVVKVLAPICVDKFQRAPDMAANLTAFKAASSYQQATFISDGGWATMVGSDKPYSGTARACAEMVSKLTQ